jgi:TatD DNase family protein
MQLFDSHCHIDLPDFDVDRDEVLISARDAGIAEILVPGVERRTWPSLLAICRQRQPVSLYPALGLHPVATNRHIDNDLAWLAERIDSDRPVAVGEIGLDWMIDGADRRRQLELFEAQLEIAAAAKLSVVLHVRKAHDEVLSALRRHPVRGGFCHAFNGSLQQAGKYIDLGFVLGFGGMLTFERSSRLRRLAATLPLDNLVLETDAPDLTVASHQYQRNSPAYLPEVLQALADMRSESVEELATRTTSNARRVIGLAE